MKVRLNGIRGSLPSNETPQRRMEFVKEVFQFVVENKISEFSKVIEEFSRVNLTGLGTDTTCVSLSGNDEELLIIDGGSGIRRLGMELMENDQYAKKPIHIYMTHFHWDHLIGLPFFIPIYRPDAEIHFHCVEGFSETALKALFRRPFFPVEFDRLQSKLVFHKLKPREQTQIAGFNLTPYRLQHPDPCWGAKVEKNGKVFSHCVDNEGSKISKEDLGPDLPIYQNVDLCYFDAQYSIYDYFDREDWGHATAQIGLEIGMREGVKKMIFAHHDPSTTSHQVFQMTHDLELYQKQKIEKMQAQNKPFHVTEWEFAVEGREYDIF